MDESIIYVQVTPEHISQLTWIMEACEFLALVTTVKQGVVMLQGTPDTCPEVKELVEHLPFEAKILNKEEAAALRTSSQIS